MAGYNVHWAIGKRYIEKQQKIENSLAFYHGIIAPDLVEDKCKSHYGGPFDKDDLITILTRKVQLYSFLQNEDIDTDYQKGVFLHLVTDYLFFNKLLHIEHFSELSYREFCKDLYYTYDYTNPYVDHKYHIDFGYFKEQIQKKITNSRKKKGMDTKEREILISVPDMFNFIEYVSDIDLEKYRDKILDNKKNVFP